MFDEGNISEYLSICAFAGSQLKYFYHKQNLACYKKSTG